MSCYVPRFEVEKFVICIVEMLFYPIFEKGIPPVDLCLLHEIFTRGCVCLENACHVHLHTGYVFPI